MSGTQDDSIQSVILGWLETGEHSDVTFQIGSEREEVKAHKIFLVSRSPIFKAMLSDCWLGSESDSSKGIEILDADIDTFRSLLMFLYTDELAEKEIPGITKLLYLADKYDVQALLQKCDAALMSKFHLENCLELLQTAKACSRNDLLAWIEKRIARKCNKFSDTRTFLDLEDKEILQSLLKRDDLNIEEVDLFKAGVRWGESQRSKNYEDGNHCHGKDEDEKKEKARPLKSILEDILPLIRFPTMSSANFASAVRPTRLLPSEDMLDIFTYLASTGINRVELGKALPYNTLSRKKHKKYYFVE